VLWPDQGAGMLWPGVFVLLASGIIVLLVARAAARPGLTGELISLGLLICVGVLLLGWLIAPSGMSVGTGTGIPAVVSLDSETPARPRALVLERRQGQLRYAVAGAPQARLGDADALAGSAGGDPVGSDPVGSDPAGAAQFADVVAGLVSGASGAVEEELGGRAIGFVVFDGPSQDPVVTELDATIGLRQLARAPQQSLWLVAGDPTRAALVDATTGSTPTRPEPEPIEVPILTTPTTIDVVLHPLTPLPRRMTVAEQADGGWRGELAGNPLELAVDIRGMIWADVDTDGSLSLTHRSWWPVIATIHLVVLVGLLVLSMPKRRIVDPDAGGEP